MKEKKEYNDIGSCRALRKAYFRGITEFTATVAKVMKDKILLRDIRLPEDEEREKETGEYVWITHAKSLLARNVKDGDRIAFIAEPYRYEKADGRSDYSLRKIYDVLFINRFEDTEEEPEESRCDRCPYMLECMNGGGECFYGMDRGKEI